MASNKTQKKVWMISAVAEAMKALPGLGAFPEVELARSKSEEAKTHLTNGEEEQARSKANEALESLEKSIEILPKKVQKMLRSQLKKIAAY